MTNAISSRYFVGVSFCALALGGTGIAHAGDRGVETGMVVQDYGSGMVVEDYTYGDYGNIVVTDDIDPNAPAPGGALDDAVDVTGVGQMVTQPNRGSFSVGLCTGTLINPRTVIFAAHCVNDIPAEDYGAASGGTPISFGFSADNLPALREWIGLGESTPYESHEDLAIYNVEQVWYDERSLPTEFLEADIAVATLDTHADDVPMWTMLFSPLTEETHAEIVGYGGTGIGSEGDNLGIDFRRRAAENMISFLGSLNDRDEWLFGPGDYGLPQDLYQLDFDSPGGPEGPDGYLGGGFDFDVFRGPGLPFEGTTAGGDSGGPLIADEAFDKPVVVGVLSGGSRYFAGQPFSSYGGSSFYQPLFMFWESIVANNSYVYASKKAGNNLWTSPAHWVQTMDPNYAIAEDGELVNALPGFEEPGVSGAAPGFGEVCFLDDCYDIGPDGTPLPDGGANSVYVPGGPGSTKFVPNNVAADPANGIKARYYDVTLDTPGFTILNVPITIDELNLGGFAELRIRPDGDLDVLSSYTQWGGILDLDGTLETGDALLGTGILQGNGLFDPTYLVNIFGLIAPNEVGNPGVLSIAGDVVLSSTSFAHFDLQRAYGDQLRILGDEDNPGDISLDGVAIMQFGTGAKTPRYHQQYVVVHTPDGRISGEFEHVLSTGSGVLYPIVDTYLKKVKVTVEAGSFRGYLSEGGVSDPYALAFGDALDALRGSNYADLVETFAQIDTLPVAQLASTFRGNAATVATDLSVVDERQSSTVRRLVSDRLSLLGRRDQTAGRIRLVGAPVQDESLSASSASQISFAQTYQYSDWQGVQLPEQVSGFMSAGYRNTSAVGAGDPQFGDAGTWHFAMGLEFALDDRNSVGTAFGHSRGDQRISGTVARVSTSQGAAYGSHQLGGGFYVGGQAGLAYSTLDAESRLGQVGSYYAVKSDALSLNGEVEFGYNMAVGDLTLTPRSSLGYSAYEVGGFNDPVSQLQLGVDRISRNGIDWRGGFKFAGETELGFASDWKVQPELQVDYIQRLSGNDTQIDLRFLEAQGVGARLPIALHDGDYGEVRGGLQFTNGNVAIGAAVEARIGQQLYRDDRAVMNMSIAF